MTYLIEEWRHLTWHGRIEGIGYLLRRIFKRPAPTETRCFMGSPVSTSLLVWCPREAVDGLWCHRHTEDYTP